ncbi:hypothetical protein AZH53_07365 [Methanomicrobiaceae archaeon CYW5]|uniref:DUF2240 family protein n=1 Tax=Methanovulcanius yangii TaxID=1789227 RepID=UPI0029CA8990|nr:DUF2240 family protein [Methanovulcanius yangii]MBT8508221.1 hypothetical protein [Methanovulcanius yangii]
MTLEQTIAAPFKAMRKEGLRPTEFIYFFAIDRKWMDRDKASLVVSLGRKQGLLREEGGLLIPTFDPSAVNIPLGFRPTNDIFNVQDNACDLLMGRLAQARGVGVEAVAAEVNALIRESFDGHLRPEAALVIVARRHGVPFEDMVGALRQTLSGDGC